MPSAEARPRLAVVGLGNRLQGDEALGSLVVDGLTQSLPAPLASAVATIDGGTLGLGLLPYLDDLDGLILVDAVDHGAAPGAVFDVEGDPLQRPVGALSVHELGAAELLGALLVQDRLPARVRIMGLQPERIGLGTELSPPVSAALPGLLARIEDRLRSWLAEAG